MSGKICQECRKAFKPSRKSQRFCSVRCGNRQRDRRRRHRAPSPGTAIRKAGAEAPALKTRDRTITRLATVQPESRRKLDSLQTKLRTQFEDLDHLEAEISEQRATIKSLHGELVRLRVNQETDAHDLIHLASRLLALGQATGVELDDATKDLFRRRGWTTAARQAEARR